MIVKLQNPEALLTAAVERTAGGLPALAALRCGGKCAVWLTPGAVLATADGVGWLLPVEKGLFPAAAAENQPQEEAQDMTCTDFAALRATCRFAGVRTLYLPAGKALFWLPVCLWGRVRRYAVMGWQPGAKGSAANTGRAVGCAVREQLEYLPAARLICQALPENLRQQGWQDLYARLCAARNRGLGKVLGTGGQQDPAGCLAVTGAFSVNRKKTYYFSDLFVQPTARHNGIGKALMLFALEGLSDGDAALLLCRSSLRCYYRKMGFARCGYMLQIKL